MEADEVDGEECLEVLIDRPLKLSVEHYEVFGPLLQVKNLQLRHDEVQVVDQKDEGHLLRVLGLTEVLLGNSLDQTCHFLLEEGQARQDHVLPGYAPVCQSIHTADEVDILRSRRVNTSGGVDAERFRNCSLHTLNVKLEHRSELRPQGHADAIVIEVEDGDLVPLLHHFFELIIQLDTEENRVYVDTAAIGRVGRSG